MQSYGLRYNETGKALRVAFLSVLIVVPAVFLIATNARALGDGGLIAVGITTVVLGVGLPIFIGIKSSPKTEVIITPEGLQLHFPNKNLFTPEDFTVPFSSVTNFYADEYQGNRYCSFKTQGKPKQFSLSCRMPRQGVNLEQYEEFKTFASTYISQYNQQSGNSASISSQTMYEAWWAQLLAFLVVLFTFIIAGLFITGYTGYNYSIFRGIIFLALGWPFVIKVWQYNYGSKKRN